MVAATCRQRTAANLSPGIRDDVELVEAEDVARILRRAADGCADLRAADMRGPLQRATHVKKAGIVGLEDALGVRVAVKGVALLPRDLVLGDRGAV